MACTGPCAAKEWQGIQHMGFWVATSKKPKKKIESAGGKYFQGRPKGKAQSRVYEMKFRDPDGVSSTVSILIGAQRGI